MKPAPSNMGVPEAIKVNFKSLSSVNQSLRPLGVRRHDPQKHRRNKKNVNLLPTCPLQMTTPSVTHNSEVNLKHFSAACAPNLTRLLLQNQMSWFNSSC